MVVSFKKLVIVSLLCFLTVMLYFFEDKNFYKNFLYTLINVLILGIVLSDSKRALSPSKLFIYFYFVFITFGVVILDLVNYPLHKNMYSILILSLLSFFVGKNLNAKKKKTLLIWITKVKPNYTKLKNISFVIYALGIIFGLIFILPNVSFLFSDFENNRVLLQGGNGLIVHMMYLIKLGIIMLYYVHIYYKKYKYFWFYVILGSMIILISGSRSGLMEIFLGMLLVRDSHIKVSSRKVIKFGIISLVLVGVLAFIRAIISGEITRIFLKIYSTMDITVLNFNYILNTFPHKEKFKYGSTYFMNFLMLLPGVQKDFTLWIKEILGLSFSGGGVTPSILGEGYLNFGFYGIYITMFVLGYYFGRLDRVYEESKFKLPSIILALYLSKSITGGIATILIIVLWYEGILYISGLLMKTKFWR